MKAKILLFTVFTLAYLSCMAQVTTQTIRGTIVDKHSQSPVPGVMVTLLNFTPPNGSTTDIEGNFKLENVPIGKQSLKISFLGYKEVVLQNLVINAGKELILNINLEEDITAINEVLITSKIEKNKPLNTMSTVSSRAFSVEETQKFAAAVNDPARMATAFAGVIQAADGNNQISIRGNSPNGLLWRMEGVEIPNPNHFSNVGTSGGGISILSAQLLTNSDFSTGAFSAEYGNALSGVFDLKLRKGNNQKREYTLQAGVLGIDVATEGPFKKNYGGSYLINYRYSTLSILNKMGISFVDAVTNFQDLSFNVSLPTKNSGTFGLFGFVGISSQKQTAEKDSLKWKLDDDFRSNEKFYSNTTAMGITNTKLFTNQSYLKTVLAFSGTQNGYIEEKMNWDYKSFSRAYEQKFIQNRITLSSTYTKKISSKSNVRTGFIINQLGYNLIQADKTDTNLLIEKINTKGNTQTAQAFFQWQYMLTPQLTTNVGLHYFQLFLNNSNAIEPRASLKYDLSATHSLSVGYGLHSQLQPIGIYFVKNTSNNSDATNRKLGLSKSHHFVLGYDCNISEYVHIKSELYYQYLFNIPVSANKNDTYSILNAIDGYTTNALNNKGSGKNYGLELTYERFLHNNLYYLLTASLSDSKYKAADNNWYNTHYNTNYALALTIGKEWTLSEKMKNRIIGFNIKSVYVGGLRYTPIDLDASILNKETRYIDSKTFEYKTPDYYRLDIRVSLKRNYKRITSTLSLDIQNATNRKNIGGQNFDFKTGEIQYWYQNGLLPILSYKLEF